MTEEEKAERRTIIENNKAWDAAEKVRRGFLKDLLAAKSMPKDALQFIAQAICTGRLHSLRRHLQIQRIHCRTARRQQRIRRTRPSSGEAQQEGRQHHPRGLPHRIRTEPLPPILADPDRRRMAVPDQAGGVGLRPQRRRVYLCICVSVWTRSREVPRPEPGNLLLRSRRSRVTLRSRGRRIPGQQQKRSRRHLRIITEK